LAIVLPNDVPSGAETNNEHEHSSVAL